MRLLPEIATIDDGSVAHSRRIVRLRDAVEKVVAVGPGGDGRVRILAPQLGLPRRLI